MEKQVVRNIAQDRDLKARAEATHRLLLWVDAPNSDVESDDIDFDSLVVGEELIKQNVAP